MTVWILWEHGEEHLSYSRIVSIHHNYGAACIARDEAKTSHSQHPCPSNCTFAVDGPYQVQT